MVGLPYRVVIVGLCENHKSLSIWHCENRKTMEQKENIPTTKDEAQNE
jgi:hypothetical protein